MGIRPRGQAFRGPRERAEGGFTLVEIAVGVTILTLGVCALGATLVHSMTLVEVNRETAEATDAARRIIEHLRAMPISDVFSSFNADPSDDPGGYGTAPAGSFSVMTGTEVSAVSRFSGQVLLPLDLDTGQLREDREDPLLGMPRDLNGDGAIDAGDHSSDYVLLPVRVRVRWTGVTGERSLTTFALLGED